MQVTFTQGTQILGIDLALVYVICPVALFLALNLDSVIMTHSFVYVTHVLVTKVVLRMRHYWRSMPKWVVIVADRFIFWSLVFISTSLHLYSLMSPEFTKQVQYKVKEDFSSASKFTLMCTLVWVTAGSPAQPNYDVTILESKVKHHLRHIQRHPSTGRQLIDIRHAWPCWVFTWCLHTWHIPTTTIIIATFVMDGNCHIINVNGYVY